MKEARVFPETPALEQAMAEALATVETDGATPFGAVLLDVAGNIVAFSAANTCAEDGPLAHAEMNVMWLALRERSDLRGLVLVSTVEPCPMCSCAAVMSAVDGIAFGTSIATIAGLGWPQVMISSDHIADAHTLRRIPVVGGVLGDRTDALARRSVPSR
ncbi:deaminase [Kitasatospora sp. MBT63]|uniref:deaminase n=1 Tax=Kitasatospora sp. MBT63 TaxID=1444768 RepID=UPI00068BA28A|nr:deaminase [Kitasatospora sp. MBT63]